MPFIAFQYLSWLQSHVSQLLKHSLSIPFELARQEYALAVKSGTVPNSMLASRDYHNFIGSAEKAVLTRFNLSQA